MSFKKSTKWFFLVIGDCGCPATIRNNPLIKHISSLPKYVTYCSLYIFEYFIFISFIPRGFRKEYIPGWNTESDQLYKEFLESGQSEIAEDLLYSLELNRKKKWMNTVENMDFRKSSRKAWNILKKLDVNSTPIINKPKHFQKK